jgi:hypothetical protein
VRSETVERADLGKAYEGSWYTILGAGGDLMEWVEGYEEELAGRGIGKPVGWYRTTGAEINEYAGKALISHRAAFPDDLTVLMFPVDGLNVGRLAIFRIDWGDRWFHDVIDNMRRK